MPHTTIPEVLISEVGPRDGLQSVKASMPTDYKKRWITALYDAGLREIEVCSFVPAKLLPQMADAAEVVKHALSLPGLTVMALVPNLRGAQAALAAGVHKLTLPVSASAAHSLANVRKTREEMVEEVRAIAALRRDIAPHVKLEAGISTAFGSTVDPSRMRCNPLTTMRSPLPIPFSMTRNPSCSEPTLTLRRCTTFLSSTT